MSFERIRSPRIRGDIRCGWLPAILVLLGWLGAGCAEERSPGPVAPVDQCVACHTSVERLTATATPDTTTSPTDPGEGCGGTVPEMEAWEKAFVSQEYLGNPGPHGGPCTGCHGGQGDRPVKVEAHAGLVADPSAGEAAACRNAACHADIADRHRTSLHGTQNGYQTMFERRGAQPAAQVSAMFEARCASCHTSCGQCHISRPDAVRGGLVHGHRFSSEPSMGENCTACHGSRVGAEFRGENRVGEQTLAADAHFAEGMDCLGCHTGAEMHGAGGSAPAHRYAVPEAPRCTDAACHADVESDANQWHAIHGRAGSSKQLACQVCHAQPYKNCYRCHVGIESDAAEVPSRIDFRIGRNPAADARHPWDFVLVRHVPIAPGSYSDWGVSMTSYDAEPTWRLATPHNVTKHTAQAYPDGYGEEVGVTCSSGCHRRPELYLTPGYLDTLVSEGVMASEEVGANEPVVVQPVWPLAVQGGPR